MILTVFNPRIFVAERCNRLGLLESVGTPTPLSLPMGLLLLLVVGSCYQEAWAALCLGGVVVTLALVQISLVSMPIISALIISH
jgi:hypothetical protein